MTRLVVGLTGGIGSGKSTVSHLFSELGIDIIDTDLIARDLVKAGMPALEEISEHFGRSVIDKKGELKRAQLRKKIFAKPQEKQWLESLLHPLIREHIRQRIAVSESPYCIVVIPLLFETQKNEAINHILVIETTKEMQVQRVMERDSCNKTEVETIMQSQVSAQTRREGADDIIENNGSLEHLQKQVFDLHEKYLQLTKN